MLELRVVGSHIIERLRSQHSVRRNYGYHIGRNSPLLYDNFLFSM
jgi:hypothetical protein